MKRSRRLDPYRLPLPGPIFGAVAGLLFALPSLAQEQSRALTITPTFTASESYTDTSARRSGYNGGEFVTRISPGLRLVSRSGRVQGSMNFLLNASHYTEHPETQTLEGWLNAAFTAEAIDKWLYVDAEASLTQQALSAYGQQTQANSLQPNSNRVPVATVSLSPHVSGSIGDLAEYSMRLVAAATEVKDSSAGDSVTTGASVSVGSKNSSSLVGWQLAANRQKVDFKVGHETVTDRVNATLLFRPAFNLRLSFNGGLETTDVGSLVRRSYDNWGLGARWTPTVRTVVSYQTDERYFGRSHALAFEHRTQRSVWRYSDVRDSTSGSDPKGVGQPITLYQLYFSQFASVQPDPVLREQLVLAYLRFLGRDPNEAAAGGLLTSGVTLQRRQDLSFGWLGRRTNLNLQAYATHSRLLDNPTSVPDAGEVRLRGYTATASHRLTPRATLSLTGSRQMTASTASRAGNDLKSLALGWTSEVNRHTSASLLARYSVFNSPTDPYREAALSASVTLRY